MAALGPLAVVPSGMAASFPAFPLPKIGDSLPRGSPLVIIKNLQAAAATTDKLKTIYIYRYIAQNCKLNLIHRISIKTAAVVAAIADTFKLADYQAIRFFDCNTIYQIQLNI
jgi:hypothetical protein